MIFKCTFAFKNRTEKILYAKCSTQEEVDTMNDAVEKSLLALSEDLSGHIVIDGCVIRLSEVIWFEVEEIEQKTEESK